MHQRISINLSNILPIRTRVITVASWLVTNIGYSLGQVQYRHPLHSRWASCIPLYILSLDICLYHRHMSIPCCHLPWVDVILGGTQVWAYVEAVLHPTDDIWKGATTMSKTDLQFRIPLKHPTKYHRAHCCGGLSRHT